MIKLQNGAGLSGFLGFRAVFPGPKRVVVAVELKTKEEPKWVGLGCGLGVVGVVPLRWWPGGVDHSHGVDHSKGR